MTRTRSALSQTASTAAGRIGWSSGAAIRGCSGPTHCSTCAAGWWCTPATPTPCSPAWTRPSVGCACSLACAVEQHRLARKTQDHEEHGHMVTPTPTELEAVRLCKTKTTLHALVREMLTGSGLEIRDRDRKLVISNPRDPDRGRIYINYITGEVSWQRPVW